MELGLRFNPKSVANRLENALFYIRQYLQPEPPIARSAFPVMKDICKEIVEYGMWADRPPLTTDLDFGESFDPLVGLLDIPLESGITERVWRTIKAKTLIREVRFSLDKALEAHYV